MKLVLLSTQSFLIKEIKKLEIKKLFIINDFSKLYDLNIEDEKFILLHHLDTKENILVNELKENFPKALLIALRNNTNNIEGCAYLKKGYKAYLNSISNAQILFSAIDAVNNGNTWIYPELMQFLIQCVPLENNQQDKLLEKLSVKELEIVELVAQGLNNSSISETLDIAEVTVKKHISSLFKKFEVKDRLALALAFKNYK